MKDKVMIIPSLWYLCKWLLAVILQVLRVDIEVIVVAGERLRAFGNARHKLLHFKEDVGLLTDIELLHRNVGWGNTIYIQKQKGGRLNKLPADSVTDLVWGGTALISHVGCMERILQVSLVKSGATLSMVTSRFPRIRGSLAIFSGLQKVK